MKDFLLLITRSLGAHTPYTCMWSPYASPRRSNGDGDSSLILMAGVKPGHQWNERTVRTPFTLLQVLQNGCHWQQHNLAHTQWCSNELQPGVAQHKHN